MTHNNLFSALRAAFPADLTATAVETDEGLHYSWQDLDRATAMMANLLKSLDLPKGSRVAVQVEKSVEAMMLYLATLRAGHVFLPLNTAYQSAEIEYFIGNAEPAVVVCSDFYSSLDDWRARLTPVAAKCRDGVLLQVCDPIEEAYPFNGRVRFFRPGQDRERLIGRAESIRDGYLDKFEQRRADMLALAGELGWRFVTHVTSEEARTPLGKLAYGFTVSGAAA